MNSAPAFRLACRRLGLNRQRLVLDTARFHPPARAGDARWRYHSRAVICISRRYHNNHGGSERRRDIAPPRRSIIFVLAGFISCGADPAPTQRIMTLPVDCHCAIAVWPCSRPDSVGGHSPGGDWTRLPQLSASATQISRRPAVVAQRHGPVCPPAPLTRAVDLSADAGPNHANLAAL